MINNIKSLMLCFVPGFILCGFGRHDWQPFPEYVDMGMGNPNVCRRCLSGAGHPSCDSMDD